MITEEEVEAFVGSKVIVTCVGGRRVVGYHVRGWQPDVDDEVPDAVILGKPGVDVRMEIPAAEVERIEPYA